MSVLRRCGSVGGLTVACAVAVGVFVLALLPAASWANPAPSLQIVFTNPNYQTLAVDHSGVAYGAPSNSETEVWRSFDEGRTWQQRSVFPGNYRLHYITPLQSGALLAAVDTGSWNIFRSDDGAATWTPVLTLPITPCFYGTLTPDNITEGDGYVFLGTYNNCPDGANTNYIYRSSDDGRTWSVIATSTTHRHVHSVRFDAGTHALYAFYGDSLGAIERSSNDGASWTPICTDYSNCVAVDAAFGDGFAVYGTDTPFQQGAIVRLDLTTNTTSRILDLPRVSYSAYALGSGRFLIGQVHEQGSAAGDGQLHLYASTDNAQTFSDVYDVAFSGNGPDRLMVQFSYPNGDFPIQYDSSNSTVVARFIGPPPANTGLPTISGTAQQGQTLSASTGSWSGSPTGYAYQWQDCDSGGANCIPIAGATSATYLLAAADVGHTIRVQVTASNSDGSAAATSAATAAVVGLPPANIDLPSISGTAQQGQTLSASTGSWSGSPTGYAYQWRDCDSGGGSCAAIAGATSSSYLLAAADVGHTIRVQVTASNGAGSSTPASSAATAAVAAAASGGGGGGSSSGGGGGGGGGSVLPDLKLVLTSDSTLAPPVGSPLIYHITVSDRPETYGATQVLVAVTLPAGYTVTNTYADRGTGCTAAAPGLVCNLDWISPGIDGHINITGTVGTTGAQTAAATVTHWLEEGNPADNTMALTLNPPATTSSGSSGGITASALTRAAILGKPKVGSILRAKQPKWSATPTLVTYHWQLCTPHACTTIKHATKHTLTLRNPYAGHTIRLLITATINGQTITSTSTTLHITKAAKL